MLMSYLLWLRGKKGEIMDHKVVLHLIAAILQIIAIVLLLFT